MKILCAAFALLVSWFSPAFADEAIVIYCRPFSFDCQHDTKVLDDNKIPYTYKLADSGDVWDELEKKMRAANINTKKFMVPVYTVRGRLLMHPDVNEVIKLYRAGDTSPRAGGAKTGDSNPIQGLFSKLASAAKGAPKARKRGVLEVSGVSMDKVPMAIIGNAVFKKGDQVEGYTIVDIRPTEVDFRDSQGKIITKKIS